MLRFCLFFALLISVGTANSQQTFSGPPTEDDYNFFCKNFGQRGEKLRDDCESRLRLGRGLGTCNDMKWSHSCSTDSMSDKKQCTIFGEGSHLFVFAQGGKLSFSVTGDVYPGETSKIRIDGNPAISFNENDGTTRAQDLALEGQIRKGKIIKTRHIKWPSGIAIDDEAPICNLPEVLDSMKADSK
jgi:hypothetical protein